MTKEESSAGATQTAAGPTVSLPDMVARDAIISWYRSEFAAANAIIDALCSHLAQVSSSPHGYHQTYDPVFAAIHRRRMNWIPVLHMQKYFSIGDVVSELRRVASIRQAQEEDHASRGLGGGSPKKPPEYRCKNREEEISQVQHQQQQEEQEQEQEETTNEKAEPLGDDSPSVDDTSSLDHSKVIDCGGSTTSASSRGGFAESASCQYEHQSIENTQICSDHEGCANRVKRITIRKGFAARESVKGHMVNVVKGLKLYEDMFLEPELARLAEFINDLRIAARNGDLAGETFIFFNKQLKGNKREIIQLGIPIFQSTKDEESSQIEPIPSLLRDVIGHLIQWRLIPESRKPNSCIINFFDEACFCSLSNLAWEQLHEEYSQPYFKPPHLDNPISTLLLYETTLAFGRSLVSDHNGNYRGSLNLALKQGSLLVMRGNSADVARHVVCPSPNSRVSITFLRVRIPSIQNISSPGSSTSDALTSQSKAITLFKPRKHQKPHRPSSAAAAGEGVISPSAVYGPPCATQTWAMAVAPPILLLPPPRPITTNNSRGKTPRNGGTGVFLPWTVGPKKYIKHLPPRIRRRRLLSLAGGPLEVQVDKPTQIPCIVV